MRLLQEIMSEYFVDADSAAAPRVNIGISGSENMPVKATKNMWEVVSSPNRLKRDFEFQDHRQQKAFLDEILEYQESVQHHAKITIDYRTVIIEVYTHNVNDITELDQEFAKTADQILEDVQHYFLSGDINEYERF